MMLGNMKIEIGYCFVYVRFGMGSHGVYMLDGV